MKCSSLINSKAKKSIIDLLKKCDSYSVAVAWAGCGDVVSEMLAQRKKINKVIIGTHFYQTNPTVLEDFEVAAAGKFRIFPPNNKTLFHPKLYLFAIGDMRIAIIGSHNLTAPAFDGKNIELSVRVSWDVTKESDDPLGIINFMEENFNSAEMPTGSFIEDYKRQHSLNRNKLSTLSEFYSRPKQKTNTFADVMALNWDDYLSEVRSETFNSINLRLQILDCAKEIFLNRGSLFNSSLLERKAIAGTYVKNEPALNNIPWGWFGTMRGQGCFKSLIVNNSADLSDALDAIPRTGVVTASDYYSFVDYFKNAFVGQKRKGGVPTASRLLAMKRPDVFFCVNEENWQGVYENFDFSNKSINQKNSVNLDNYWEKIIGPIQTTSWWNSPAPTTENDRRIWRYRSALLDCIYYA